MNIVNRLTIRHLKENKRRTLVTIFGVIISVAMLTAVATLGVSFLDLLIRQEISQNGEWHVQYKNANKEGIEAIANDESTKKLVIANDLGYALLEGSENQSKPYLFVKEYNEQGFNQFPIELSEGRLPEANNEVVISEAIADNAGVVYEIGDELTLEIGNRHMAGMVESLSQMDPLQRTGEVDNDTVTEELQIETTKTYTIVGTVKRPTWEPMWAPGYTMISYVDESTLAPTETVDVAVVLNKINGSLYKNAEDLAKHLNISKVNYNSELLRFYGVTDNDSLRTTLFSLAGIIMAVVIIGSVSLIYNAFAISVSERSRHLGMLASVGATKRQKRNSVFFEGAIIGGISIPIGLLAGIGGIAVTFTFLNSFIEDALNVTEKLVVVVTPSSILVACVLSIATIFISTYLPARRASRISAIDAIRQTQDVKLSGKAVKTSKLVRKIFGIEAEIGLKNLKRNKKRYQATVFSLIISIVLFLTVSFFTTNLGKSVEMSQETVNYDIQVMGSSDTDVSEYEPLTKLTGVTEDSVVKEIYLNSLIEEEYIADGIVTQDDEGNSILQDGKYPYYIVMRTLDAESFEAYASKIGVNADEFKNPEKPSVIVIEKTKYQEGETGKFIETKSIKAQTGQLIDLYSTNFENGELVFLQKVEIGALTDQAPMGVSDGYLGGLDIIVSEEVFNGLVNEKIENEVNSYLYMTSSDPMATQEELDEVLPSDLYVYNVFQRRQQSQQMILFMSVFTYGFIALITSISIANIFNTISTSISLRKREFAMLKSVGMTPKGFDKMINYESIFYGLKALLYGLPISVIVMYLIYRALQGTFEYGFTLPWMSIIQVVVAIFLIVSITMLYSIRKIRKENIIDSLKQECI